MNNNTWCCFVQLSGSMLEDALDFADLAEQFSKQDSKKQTGECYQQILVIGKPFNKHLYFTAAVKKDKKNSVLDSRKTYNICKCMESY